MDLSKIILLLIIPLDLFAFTQMATKQDIRNLRYVTKDGKYTYYQRRSGSLIFATNYKVKEIISGEIGTQYNIVEGSGKKLLITKDQDFHTYYNSRKNHDIFVVDISKPTPKKVGNGNNPALHLNDTWISYYSSQNKIITFKSLVDKTASFEIKINNSIDSYYVPKVLMINKQSVLYTDLSKKGNEALLQLEAGKTKNIYGFENPLKRMEICKDQNQLYMLEYGIENLNKGTMLSRVSLSAFDITKRDFLYESKSNDLPSLICKSKNNVFLITNEKGAYEVSSIKKESPFTKKVLTAQKHISQIIIMDSKIITPFRGKFYLIDGKNNLTKTDLLYDKSP